MGTRYDATEQSGDWRTVADLPRPLAFVLSGGASSGATQVGMLQALRDAGIRPDIVVGTSVGAINGVMVAGLPRSGADHLAGVWRDIDRSAILGMANLFALPRLVRTRRHLFCDDALRRLIRRNLPCWSFTDLPIRFAAVATHVATGTPRVIDAGQLETALLASAAIPGVFPRVQVDGQWYFDGGVTANLPIRQALDLGARSVIVLDASPEPSPGRPPTSIAETLHYVVGLLMRSQISSDATHVAGRCPIVTLPRTTPAGVGPFDFSRSADLMERGYTATRRFLSELVGVDDEGALPPLAAAS